MQLLKCLIGLALVTALVYSYSAEAQSNGATFTHSETNCSPVLGRCTVTKTTLTYDAGTGTWSITSVTEYSFPYEVEQPPILE